MAVILGLVSQPIVLFTLLISVLLTSLLTALIVGRNSRLTQALKEDSNQQQLKAMQSQLTALREQKLVLETQRQYRDEQLQNAQVSSDKLRVQVEQQQRQLSEQGEQMAALKTQLQQQREAAADKISMLEQTRQQLSKEFELLANRIFDEKTERFNKNSKVTLEGALNPLREQLKDFKQKVEDVYDKDSKERTTLVAELGHLKQLNLQMSADALNLTNALKGDNKAQGNWGEVILERVLEESGLTKGREYDTQVNLQAGQGRNQQPDVIVRLPENKDLIIDAKVSLLHYERYCNSEHEAERQQALKEHIASVRGHIKNLSIKNYEGLEGLRTLDFVFIFIPIESAFMVAFEQDQSMFRDAYEKNIIVVSPTTLLATLRTIQSIWRYERQNKNAEEIARQAGAMHDKFVGFINDLDKIADYLTKASHAHDSAMSKLSAGKGNLVSSTQRLEKLGAKVKKAMPATALERNDEQALAELESLADADNAE